MKKWISFLLIIIMLISSLSALAEDIMEKGAKPTEAPSTEIESQGAVENSSSVVSNKKSTVVVTRNNTVSQNKATTAPTATPRVTATKVPPAVPQVKSGATTQPPAANLLAELKETWLSKDQFYYQQLSSAHKAAWEADIANVLNYPNQTSARSSNARYQALAPMIKADNPRIFWIDWIDSKGCLRFETGSTATYAALQFPTGETLASLQETFLAAIPKAVADIEKSLPANPTAADKARAIHNWLCKNNSYNSAQTSSHKRESDPVAFAYLAAHSAFSAIIPGDTYEPVCEGYAMAFKLLCEEFGLEAICVSGSTKNISNHMWNYVKLDDGQWYLVDVDSDDLAASYVQTYCLVGSAQSAANGYTPNPYLGSGVNPSNGYSEGAAFTVPALAN